MTVTKVTPTQIEAASELVGSSSNSSRAASLRHRRTSRFAKLSFLHICCIAIALGVFAGPILFFALQSFKTMVEFTDNSLGFPKHWNFDNYAQAWRDGNFERQFVNSLLMSTIPVAITLLNGVFLAFPIARGYISHARFWYVFFIFSGFIPPALIPLFDMARFLHIYNSLPGYLLLLSLQGAGFFFFVGYMKSIPREREEAAAMDGCGYVRFVFTILIPEMKPALASFAIFGFVEQWNNLILPLILLPNPNLWPASRGLYGFFGTYQTNWPLVAAATVIVAIPMVVVFALLQRYIIAGVSGGATGVGMDDGSN